MATFNAREIEEINEIITQVAKMIKPKSEVGAHDKALLGALLKTSKKKATFFKCKREYSDAIVNHFVKEKSVTKSRFHKNSQAYVFVI